MGDGVVMQNSIGQQEGVRRAWQPYMVLSVSFMCVLQVLRYFDYVFTGVFTFEMVIKVTSSRENLASGFQLYHLSVLRPFPHNAIS